MTTYTIQQLDEASVTVTFDGLDITITRGQDGVRVVFVDGPASAATERAEDARPRTPYPLERRAHLGQSGGAGDPGAGRGGRRRRFALARRARAYHRTRGGADGSRRPDDGVNGRSLRTRGGSGASLDGNRIVRPRRAVYRHQAPFNGRPRGLQRQARAGISSQRSTTRRQRWKCRL
jgi:hypothetical protein